MGVLMTDRPHDAHHRDASALCVRCVHDGMIVGVLIVVGAEIVLLGLGVGVVWMAGWL